jgi:hypothetical protein
VLKFIKTALLVGVATMACAEIPPLVGCTSTGVQNGSVNAPELSSGTCGASTYLVNTFWSNTWVIDDTNPGDDATAWYMPKAIQKDPATGNTVTVSTPNGWGSFPNLSCGNNYTATNDPFSTNVMTIKCVLCKNDLSHNYSYKVWVVPGYGTPQPGNRPQYQGASVDSTYVTTPSNCGVL